MRMLTRWVFLICLLVPLAANGQNRILMPSLDVGLGMSWKEYEYPGFLISRRHRYDVLLNVELIILNPNRKLLQNLRPFHRVSIGAYTGYGIGIGSIGRLHFIGVSAGVFLSNAIWSEFDWALRLQGKPECASCH